MVMMSLMNPSINASLAVMYTARGPTYQFFANCYLSSFDSKDMCGELRFSVSQYSYLSRSFTRSIDAFLTVVYSAGVDAVPKDEHRQRKSSLSTIAMQINVI